jgi:hypothetical protein
MNIPMRCGCLQYYGEKRAQAETYSFVPAGYLSFRESLLLGSSVNRGNMPPSSRCRPLAVYFEVIPMSSERVLGLLQG